MSLGGFPVLSSQKLLAAMFLQKKSIMQVLATNILMRVSIVRIVCQCFLPSQENRTVFEIFIKLKSVPYWTCARSNFGGLSG